MKKLHRVYIKLYCTVHEYWEKRFCFLWTEEEAFFTRPGRNDGKALDTLDENAAEQSDKEKTTNYSEEVEADHTEEKTEEEEKIEDYSDEDEVEKIVDYYLDEEKLMTENHGGLQSKVWLQSRGDRCVSV